MRTTTVVLVLAWTGTVCCNTAIVKLTKFSALELPAKPSPTWPVLSTLPGQNSGTFQIGPIMPDDVSKNSNVPLAHDFWVVLEIDEWRKEGLYLQAFTLRLSWPASMAVDFDITIFKPSASHMDSNSAMQPVASWSRYARLRASRTGLRVTRDSANPQTGSMVQFNLIVEPLLWGAIPRSIMPVLLFLFVVIGVSSWVASRVWSHLSQVAEEARGEADKKHQ